MNAIYLLIIIAGLSLQNVFKKAYTKANNGGICTFSTVTSIVAGLIFLIMGIKKFNFEMGMIGYALGFAISYAVSTVFSILSIANGSLALSSLLVSYSLVIPTFWGIIFRGENIGAFLVIGLVLLALSLALINMNKNASEETIKITPKWILYIFLAFLGNGFCSTFQTAQQIAFDGRGKNEFMCIALLMVSISLLIISFTRERKHIIISIKNGGKYMVLCGMSNALLNLFVMVLSNCMPASVMFPLISAGGVIATAIISSLFYKEKLTSYQMAGLIFGIGSVVFLNL